MKKVIVPVDFSDTSLNAARFAAQMFKGQDDLHIILYHMFENEEDDVTTRNYLENIRTELLSKGDKNIECITELGDDFIDSLTRLAFQKSATMIVMGIAGKSELRQVLIGSNTLKMTDQNVCPVMIIPPDASFNEIKNVAFTSDFRNVSETTPVLFIKQVLQLFKPSLHIVNVDNQHYVSLTEEFQEERAKFLEMFKEYKPEFYFIGMNDFFEAVEQFVHDKKIDLIVTVPRYHSFLSRMIKGTHTKKLVFQSSVPILAVHE